MLQAKCPYVERTGSCYVRASCHFCNFHSILTRFVNAPAFTPATKPKTAPFNDDDLPDVDLDDVKVHDNLYRKVQIPGAAAYSAPDYSANMTAASQYPQLPSGVAMMPHSFNKANFTVQGSDGKTYSATALFTDETGGGASAFAPDYMTEEVKEMEGYADPQNMSTYFYEYSQDCSCCKGLVYNCRGMQTGDVSCISQCFCLTELQHGMSADY